MHDRFLRLPPFHRLATGLATVASWLLATSLFASGTWARSIGLETEGSLLAAAGWISGLLATSLLAHLIDRR